MGLSLCGLELALCLGDGGGILWYEAFGGVILGGTAIGLTGGTCGDTGPLGCPPPKACGGPFGAGYAHLAPAITVAIWDRGTGDGAFLGGIAFHFAAGVIGLG